MLNKIKHLNEKTNRLIIKLPVQLDVESTYYKKACLKYKNLNIHNEMKKNMIRQSHRIHQKKKNQTIDY